MALDDGCGDVPLFPLSSLPLQQLPMGARRFKGERAAEEVKQSHAEAA